LIPFFTLEEFSMIRVFSVCAALLTLAPWCHAQEPTETVIRLTVTPAAAPKPALRYQLLPEMSELSPGNAIQGYLKCFMEQNNFFHHKESVEKREQWLELPLKDLPLKEMHQFGYGKGNGPCRMADQAARLESADWQTLLPMRKEGVNLLIPEVQQLRMLAAALRVRWRLEIAEGRFEDAVAGAKTMFALARHLGEHPTLIGDLVALAVVSIALETLEEMVEQPRCPNLYWALVNLPSPLIDLRKGMQGERQFMATEFNVIDPREPMSQGEIKKAIKSMQALHDAVRLQQHVEAWLAARAKDQDHVAAAKKRLIQSGIVEDHVKQFPAEQVILLDETRAVEVQRDEDMKLMLLPWWEIEAVRKASPAPARDDNGLLSWMPPAINKVRMAQARVEQRLALMRTVEALRLYAADHKGELPAKLADIKLPMLADPITGRPFGYKLDNGIATIQGTAPRGMEKQANYNVRFEIKIAK
jgi:hypothetical protein